MYIYIYIYIYIYLVHCVDPFTHYLINLTTMTILSALLFLAVERLTAII